MNFQQFGANPRLLPTANSQMENSVNDMFKEKYAILIEDGLETLICIVLGTNGMDNSLSEAILKQKLSFS